ncbi:MAG: efflux RND transporter periplasmic adaptor subunit [Candidatus Binatia bacterium]
MARKFLVPSTPLKKMFYLFAILSLIGGSWYASASLEQKPRNNLFRPVLVTQDTIEEVITAQGKLEPREYVDVGTQVSGQLKQIHVEIGDIVAKDQLLAEIDQRVYQAQLEANAARLKSLKAQLNEQKAQATLAEQNLKRNQNLITLNAISQQALQESEAEAAAARARVGATLAQIEEVESNLEGNQTNLEFTKILAPMAGTVTTMSAREGQTLNANQTAPIILQVADLDKMTVRAQVAEADVMRLKEGMAAYFTTLGNAEYRWEGKVRQILPAPEVLNDVVLYHVLIDVENEGRQLMTGMTTQVFFLFGKAENVLIIPAEALSQREPAEDNEKGKAYRVRVLTESGPDERLIYVGLQTRTQAEVTAGLQEGEQLLVRRPSTSTAQNSSASRGGMRRFGGGPRL